MESNTAEVIWYAVPNGRSLPGDPSESQRPRRSSSTRFIAACCWWRRSWCRCRARASMFTTGTANNRIPFYNQYDLSVRCSAPRHAQSCHRQLARRSDESRRTDFCTPSRSGRQARLPIGTPSKLATLTERGASPPAADVTSSFPFPFQNPSYISNPDQSDPTSLLTSLLVCQCQRRPHELDQRSPAAGRRRDSDRRAGVRHSRVRSDWCRVVAASTPILRAASQRSGLLSCTLQYRPRTTIVGYGAFVDLGYGVSRPIAPAVTPRRKSTSYFSASRTRCIATESSDTPRISGPGFVVQAPR